MPSSVKPVMQLILQMYPFRIPDLSSECPLTVFGRYSGHFPDQLKVRGIIADLSTCVIDVKIHKAKNIPLDKVELILVYNVYTFQA